MSILLLHIAFARLVDLVEGRSAEAERAELTRHLAVCAHCQAAFAQLERLIGLMRQDRSEDAPAHVIGRAVRLFRPQVSAEAPSLLRRIVATLGFDSAQLAPALGVRSSASGARQLLYHAAPHDLDIRMHATHEGWVVAGQLLSTESGGRVALRGSVESVEHPLNELSGFSFPPVPPGEYSLVVYLPDELIEVASLPVGG